MWVKLDDKFFDHPKVTKAGQPATMLYLAGLAYCAAHLTDGLISAEQIGVLTRKLRVRKAQVDRLVAVGLWETAEDGAYLVHDYLDFNPSSAQVKAKLRANADRQKSFRERHPEPETPNRNGHSNALLTASRPVPSRPVQEKKEFPSVTLSELAPDVENPEVDEATGEVRPSPERPRWEQAKADAPRKQREKLETLERRAVELGRTDLLERCIDDVAGRDLGNAHAYLAAIVEGHLTNGTEPKSANGHNRAPPAWAKPERKSLAGRYGALVER